MAKGILLVDDAAFMRMMLKDILVKNGYEVLGEAENGLKAIEKYKELNPDLVIMDITMPEMDGIDAVKEIKKINANAMDSKGANALHYLARRQDLPSITYLIDKGAQIDLVDKDGNTPLMNACYGTNLDIVKALYKDQNLVNKINKKGDTALQIALQRSNNEVVAFLLAEGATINAVNNKGENLIEALLKGYNPRKKDGEADFDKKVTLLQKYKVSLEQPNVQGNTALHIAIQRGNRKLIEKVLPWVNINAKNKEGETALIKAAMVAKDTEVLEYLISKGADKTSTTELGETAYDLAKENESLQKSGANLEFLK